MREIKKVMAIVYSTKNNKPYFLVLHRILRWKGWETFKETIKKSETPHQALLRGIKEETGLKQVRIIKRIKHKKITWFWPRHGKVIINNLYLVRANMNEKTDLNQKIKEHSSYKWLPKSKAIKVLTFKNSKDLLRSLKTGLR